MWLPYLTSCCYVTIISNILLLLLLFWHPYLISGRQFQIQFQKMVFSKESWKCKLRSQQSYRVIQSFAGNRKVWLKWFKNCFWNCFQTLCMMMHAKWNVMIGFALHWRLCSIFRAFTYLLPKVSKGHHLKRKNNLIRNSSIPLLFSKNGLTPTSFCLFSLFSNTNFTDKTPGVIGIRTEIVGIEGKHADHLTTTTALFLYLCIVCNS